MAPRPNRVRLFRSPDRQPASPEKSPAGRAEIPVRGRSCLPVSPVRLYGHYLSVCVRAMMQYKASFLMTTLGQGLTSLNMLLGIYFLFRRFGSVKGYTFGEVLLCASVMLASFSLAECFARGFDHFPSMVRKGEFDRVLVRPRSAVLQILGSRADLTRLGRLAVALLLFGYGLLRGGVHWTPGRVVAVGLMLSGGTAVFFGLFLLHAALCFYTMDGLEFMNIFTDGAREYGMYPVDIYGARMMRFCTYVIPYALVQYYPLTYLIGRSDSFLRGLLPMCALLFLLPCYALWRLGVRHYTSSGS